MNKNDETIKDKIEEHIVDEGFVLGFIGDPSHFEGLPGDMETCVKPDFRFVEGASTVVVTATTVQRWALMCPFNYSNWNPRGPAMVYTSKSELTEALRKLARKPTGCWL